jgi:predicted metal-dependent hydrolase
VGSAKNKVREDHHSIYVGGHKIPLIVRRHPRARRIILRINTAGEGAVVTIPAHTDPADGLEMARRQSVWLGKRLDEMGARIEFSDGAQVPFQGQDYTVRHNPTTRGTVWIEDGEINVAGDVRHMTRRLNDWMKKQARTIIVPLAHAKASNIGHALSRITIRDTRTRWGSCSSNGDLSFSWRLVMAPSEILDYVVAHEVAHLKHMNHNPEFWHTVDILTANSEHGRNWLSNNGGTLHRIG